jgi:hypothetical protein
MRTGSQALKHNPHPDRYVQISFLLLRSPLLAKASHKYDMSGVEALGVASAVVQLVQFGAAVLKRLDEYRTAAGGLPRALEDVALQLQALHRALDRTQKAIDEKVLTPEDEKVLQPIIYNSKKQIQDLKDLMEKALPEPGARLWRRVWTAGKSLANDDKLSRIYNGIQATISMMTLHAATFAAYGMKSSMVPYPST